MLRPVAHLLLKFEQGLCKPCYDMWIADGLHVIFIINVQVCHDLPFIYFSLYSIMMAVVLM